MFPRQMVQAGFPVYTAHVDEDALLPFHDSAKREGIKAVLSLPILFQNQVIGIMRLLSKNEHRSFTKEEIARAMALAMQHDLQLPLPAKKRLRRLIQRLLAGRRWPLTGEDEFMRKAVRRH